MSETETKVWDEDKIAAAAEVAARAYVADLNKIWEEFGGFPGDFGIAGWELWRALSDDPDCIDHYTAFIDFMWDGLDEMRSGQVPDSA